MSARARRTDVAASIQVARGMDECRLFGLDESNETSDDGPDEVETSPAPE